MFVEIGLSGEFNTISIVAVGDFVEVFLEDFVFGVFVFEFDGEDEFFEFADVRTFGSEKSVFNKLLSDGGAAAGNTDVATFVKEGAGKTAYVEAGVFVEFVVFDGESSVDEMFWDLIDGDAFAVFFAVDAVKEVAFAVED